MKAFIYGGILVNNSARERYVSLREIIVEATEQDDPPIYATEKGVWERFRAFTRRMNVNHDTLKDEKGRIVFLESEKPIVKALLRNLDGPFFRSLNRKRGKASLSDLHEVSRQLYEELVPLARLVKDDSLREWWIKFVEVLTQRQLLEERKDFLDVLKLFFENETTQFPSYGAVLEAYQDATAALRALLITCGLKPMI